jgi:hypothetical protein
MGCALIQEIAISVTIHCIAITNTGSGIYYYSISPAIRNGLSFNKETGTISGAPIVAADPVTYVITAYGFYFFDDTATVVIAVGAGTINLMIVKKFTVTFKKKFVKISSTFLFLLLKLILKNMKKIITTLAVLLGLAAVF